MGVWGRCGRGAIFELWFSGFGLGGVRFELCCSILALAQCCCDWYMHLGMLTAPMLLCIGAPKGIMTMSTCHAGAKIYMLAALQDRIRLACVFLAAAYSCSGLRLSQGFDVVACTGPCLPG